MKLLNSSKQKIVDTLYDELHNLIPEEEGNGKKKKTLNGILKYINIDENKNKIETILENIGYEINDDNYHDSLLLYINTRLLGNKTEEIKNIIKEEKKGIKKVYLGNIFNSKFDQLSSKLKKDNEKNTIDDLKKNFKDEYPKGEYGKEFFNKFFSLIDGNQNNNESKINIKLIDKILKIDIEKIIFLINNVKNEVILDLFSKTDNEKLSIFINSIEEDKIKNIKSEYIMIIINMINNISTKNSIDLFNNFSINEIYKLYTYKGFDFFVDVFDKTLNNNAIKNLKDLYKDGVIFDYISEFGIEKTIEFLNEINNETLKIINSKIPLEKRKSIFSNLKNLSTLNNINIDKLEIKNIEILCILSGQIRSSYLINEIDKSNLDKLLDEKADKIRDLINSFDSDNVLDTIEEYGIKKFIKKIDYYMKNKKMPFYVRKIKK